jgi:hypothetical protein
LNCFDPDNAPAHFRFEDGTGNAWLVRMLLLDERVYCGIDLGLATKSTVMQIGSIQLVEVLEKQLQALTATLQGRNSLEELRVLWDAFQFYAGDLEQFVQTLVSLAGSGFEELMSTVRAIVNSAELKPMEA